jgi:hypothetical protein
MKNGLKRSALVAAVLLSALWCRAQQPGMNPAPPPPAPVNGAPGNPPPPGLRPAGLTQLVTVSGKVIKYVANDRYEYDGITLQNNEKTMNVKFPAHLGAQLMKAAPKGSELTLSGTYDNSPEGAFFRFYSLKNGDSVITDTPPPIDQAPPAKQFKNFSGTISGLNHDQSGVTNGVIINGKMLISLPPPAVQQLAVYLKTGEKISGTGVQRIPPSGVVTAGNLEFTDARTLSISGQTYLIR